MLLVSEKRFRRLDSPELLKEVYEGVEFADGVAIKKGKGLLPEIFSTPLDGTSVRCNIPSIELNKGACT